jgi:cytochrome P450
VACTIAARFLKSYTRFAHLPVVAYNYGTMLYKHLKRTNDVGEVLHGMQMELVEKASSEAKAAGCGMALLPVPGLAVFGVDAARDVLANTQQAEKGMMCNAFRRIHPNMMVFSAFDYWKQQRKQMGPAFHSSKLAQMTLPLANAQAQKLAEALRGNKDSNYVNDVRAEISRTQLQIICETALEGHEVACTSEEFEQFTKDMQGLFLGSGKLAVKPWFFLIPNLHMYLTQEGREFKKARDSALKFIRKIINKRMEDRKNSAKGSSFLSILIEQHLANPKAMPIEEVEGQMLMYIIGGHETLNASITFTLYLLGLPENSEEQVKIHKQLDKLFADNNDLEITADKVKELPALENAFKEAMRLYPPIMWLNRETTEPLMVNNQKIPTGTQIQILPYHVHRDQEYWGENVEEFVPSRFENEKINSYQYIPFSAGIRNCIGQKQAMNVGLITLAHALRQSKVESHLARDQLRLSPTVCCNTVQPLAMTFSQRPISA